MKPLISFYMKNLKISPGGFFQPPYFFSYIIELIERSKKLTYPKVALEFSRNS